MVKLLIPEFGKFVLEVDVVDAAADVLEGGSEVGVVEVGGVNVGEVQEVEGLVDALLEFGGCVAVEHGPYFCLEGEGVMVGWPRSCSHVPEFWLG